MLRLTLSDGVWALDTLAINPEITADLLVKNFACLPLWIRTVMRLRKQEGAIIYQEDSMFGGIASDISAVTDCFEYLDAPVIRVASFRFSYSIYKKK
jgi:2-oxoisovalerate dehydrogenase E1 component